MTMTEWKYLVNLAEDLCVYDYIIDKLDASKDYEQQRIDVVIKEFEKRYCK